jgi:hypothetical protein
MAPSQLLAFLRTIYKQRHLLCNSNDRRDMNADADRIACIFYVPCVQHFKLFPQPLHNCCQSHRYGIRFESDFAAMTRIALVSVLSNP